jgi:N-acetylneuraminic acid mutarotase
MSLLRISLAIIALAALSPAAPLEIRNNLAKKTPNWTELPVLGNGPRQELSTVALDNEIYIFGGIPLPDAAGAIPTLDSVEVYSLAAKTWRNTTALPIPMNHANGKCNLSQQLYSIALDG